MNHINFTLQIIDEIASIQQQWNEENEALVESHQQYVRELGYEFDEKLRLGQQLQKHIQQDKAKLEVEYSLLNQSIDSDCDVEMENLKAKYIQRLKLEEDNVMALMTEHALLKKSLQTLGKVIVLFSLSYSLYLSFSPSSYVSSSVFHLICMHPFPYSLLFSSLHIYVSPYLLLSTTIFQYSLTSTNYA